MFGTRLLLLPSGGSGSVGRRENNMENNVLSQEYGKFERACLSQTLFHTLLVCFAVVALPTVVELNSPRNSKQKLWQTKSKLELLLMIHASFALLFWFLF